MKRIYEIIEEVKALRGANVEVFGQPTTLTSDYGKYIIDYNTGLVYDLPGGYMFKDFLEELLEKGKIKLIQYGKKMSKELLNELENSY